MNKTSYKKLVPKDSFIWKYMDHMSDYDTPVSYDFWCAMWLVGVAAGRNAYVDRPNAPVYLQSLMTLVDRKSSHSLDMSLYYAGEVARAIVSPSDIVNKDFSKGTIDLAVDTGMTQYLSATLESILGVSGIKNMLAINLAFDFECEFGMLASSASGWLGERASTTIDRTPFWNNNLLIIADTNKPRNPWRDRHDNPSNVKLQAAKESLQALKEGTLSTQLRIKPTQSCLESFNSWYTKHERGEDIYRQSFEVRQDAHVLRTAALLGVNERVGYIGGHNLTRAIELVSIIKSNGAYLMGSGPSYDIHAKTVERVKQLLIRAGHDGLPQRDLRMGTHNMIGDAAYLNDILKAMQTMKCLDRYLVKREGSNRTSILWRANKLIQEVGITRLICEKMSPIIDG